MLPWRHKGLPVMLENLEAINVEQANESPVARATSECLVDLGDDPVEQAGVQVLGHTVSANRAHPYPHRSATSTSSRAHMADKTVSYRAATASSTMRGDTIDSVRVCSMRCVSHLLSKDRSTCMESSAVAAQ